VISDQTALGTLTHSTKADAAYVTLRAAILDGRLYPGERVTLAGLAANLGMSPMPIRDALKRLSGEGLVVLTPHTDTVIAPFDIVDVEQIFVLRANLESLAARLAAKSVTPDLLGELWTLHAGMKEQMESEDFEAFAQNNRRFHEAIFEAANNPYLRRMLGEVWTLSYRFRAGYRIIPGRAAAAHREHHQIVLALSENNEEAAETAMRTHVSAAGAELGELIQSGDVTWPISAARSE
jgi:DNA-binding GntR family transcriptional regulator